jgi:hypothetical protein
MIQLNQSSINFEYFIEYGQNALTADEEAKLGEMKKAVKKAYDMDMCGSYSKLVRKNLLKNRYKIKVEDPSVTAVDKEKMDMDMRYIDDDMLSLIAPVIEPEIDDDYHRGPNLIEMLDEGEQYEDQFDFEMNANEPDDIRPTNIKCTHETWKPRSSDLILECYLNDRFEEYENLNNLSNRRYNRRQMASFMQSIIRTLSGASGSGFDLEVELMKSLLCFA